MDAQQIEGLFVSTACIAFGITLLVVRGDVLPEPLRSWSKGRFRTPLAVGAILVGGAMSALALTGRF